MFARALFPTDFSAYANAVFACLPELKTAGLREVVVLNVIRESDVPLPETVNRESLARIRWSVDEQLNVARMALEGQGLRVITCTEYGSPAAQIVRVAEDERVNLIVMGAQGVTAMEELLLGSVTYEVVRRATVPLLIEKFQVVRELGHVKCRNVCAQTFTRVLHPTDFSTCADIAFQTVKRLKSAGTEEVFVLHVQDERMMKQRSPEQLNEFDKHDTERLETLCRSLHLYGLQAHALLRHGIPFRETLQVAGEIDAHLIVLGSQGHSAIRELLAGSTVENIVRLSHRPVLVVRCPEEDN